MDGCCQLFCYCSPWVLTRPPFNLSQLHPQDTQQDAVLRRPRLNIPGISFITSFSVPHPIMDSANTTRDADEAVETDLTALRPILFSPKTDPL